MKFKSKRGYIQLVAVFIAFALIIVAGSVTILASKPNKARGFGHNICQKFPDNAACRSPKPITSPTPSPCIEALASDKLQRVSPRPLAVSYPSLPCPSPTPYVTPGTTTP